MITYARVCDWDNLWLAWRKAARGKRSRPAAATFEYRLEDNLVTLQEELVSKTYRPGGYASFTIHEPKRRLISAAPFRDRVVHHALCNIMEPVFERSFIFDSYANRVGKGTHRALDRCQEFARRYRYVLSCDVRQFFPSIDLALLRHTLHRKVRDGDVLWLIDRIMESGIGVLSEEYEMTYFPGDDLFAAARPRGLPIGNLTSQFWANCYLSPFDHFVQRELRCPAYLRYVDDFLLFSDDKRQLWSVEGRAHRATGAVAAHDPRRCRASASSQRGHPFPGLHGVPGASTAQTPQRNRLSAPPGRSGCALCGWPDHTRSGHGLGAGLDESRAVREYGRIAERRTLVRAVHSTAKDERWKSRRCSPRPLTSSPG